MSLIREYFSENSEPLRPDQTPFDVPSQKEIEKLIRENGFTMSVIMRVLDLLSGMLTAPFRWVYRVGEFLIIVLKLAAEAIYQFHQRHGKSLFHRTNITNAIRFIPPEQEMV